MPFLMNISKITSSTENERIQSCISLGKDDCYKTVSLINNPELLDIPAQLLSTNTFCPNTSSLITLKLLV